MTIFQFEADFVESLRCIPMQVRYKLDTCGVKLKLEHWNRFTHEEKQSLVDMPCDPDEGAIAYREFLQNLVVSHTGTPAHLLPIDPHPPWMNTITIPQQVQEKVSECHCSLSIEGWIKLSPLQRFALIKLSRPSHENRNFLSAMQEFGLA